MKVLFYVHARESIGHLTRCSTIIDELNRYVKDIDIVSVVNCPSKIYKARLKGRTIDITDQLPSNIIRSAGRLSSTFDKVFVPIISKEKPQLIIFDSFFSVKATKLPCMSILILRKMKEADMHEFIDDRLYSYFDRVLLPHHKTEMLEYEIPDAYHVGPIIRQHQDANSSSCEGILATVGGGGFKEVDRFIQTCTSAKLPKGIQMTIQTGLYNETKYDDLENITFKKEIKEFPSALRKASLVISLAGYNTVNEIINEGKNAILYPLRKKNDDQKTRAIDASMYPSIDVLDSLDPDELSRLIAEKIDLQYPSNNLSNIGLYSIRNHILKMLSVEIKRIRINCGNNCNNRCIFCDQLNMMKTKEELLNIDPKKYDTIELPCNADSLIDFEEHVTKASYLGLKIVLHTNGRMWAYNDFAYRHRHMFSQTYLYFAGIGREHDEIIRAEGFKQTMQGMENMISNKMKFTPVIVVADERITKELVQIIPFRNRIGYVSTNDYSPEKVLKESGFSNIINMGCLMEKEES